jgi:coenzyme F420-reducing hydrogenase alpha subunit
MTKVSVEHVARIEGHGTISVEMDGSRITDVRMDVIEPARFFEAMVVGRRFDEVSLVTSRICGICSPNHALTSLKAVEAALGVAISERTEVLRKLLVYGSYLQNHATHLYVFAAPDFVGLPSVLPLAVTHPDVVGRALLIKKTGNELTSLVGGRPVHPVTAVVGGFTSEPSAGDLASMRDRLNALADEAIQTARLFHSFAIPEFVTEGEMVALVSADDYAIYQGDIGVLEAGVQHPVSEYHSVITEKMVAHSNAKHSVVDGRTFMVGALPRLLLSADRLMPSARAIAGDLGLLEGAKNPFLNNASQAVELVDAAERCIGYIEQLLEMGGTSLPDAVEVRAGRGSAATEAPRGTLYHSYTLDDEGIVLAGDVITPTAQNLGNLDADMRRFAPTQAGLPQDEFLRAMEMLVRAYDPCLSCSVH